MRVGGQDHMYLEGQIALAVPGEDDEMVVFASTQHPSEAQHMVAHALGVPANAVVMNVRRMGGGFGGKETQMNLFCAVAALAARATGRAVKLRPDRDQDMEITGKRHDFRIDYDLGFDDGRAAFWRSMACLPRAAAGHPTCPAPSPTARCSMPTTPISTPMCACARARSRPTRSATRRFAALAARKG